MPSFSFAPGRGGPFHWPKRPSEEVRCCGVLEGGGPASVSRECPRGGNLPAPPGGSSFGGGVLGGVPAASALFFLSWGGGLPWVLRGYGVLWCLGGRAGAACGVGLGLVGWGGGWGGGVAPLGGVFGLAAGVWCPFRAFLRVPPILFRFFCCSVPYVMYVAELQSCSVARA